MKKYLKNNIISLILSFLLLSLDIVFVCLMLIFKLNDNTMLNKLLFSIFNVLFFSSFFIFFIRMIYYSKIAIKVEKDKIQDNKTKQIILLNCKIYYDNKKYLKLKKELDVSIYDLLFFEDFFAKRQKNRTLVILDDIFDFLALFIFAIVIFFWTLIPFFFIWIFNNICYFFINFGKIFKK